MTPANRPVAGREHKNPLDFDHAYPSMRRFAETLALRYDCNRTRCAYYRQVRLLCDHFKSDPATLTEDQYRDYVLHLKFQRHWKPKTIRQALAAAGIFFAKTLGRELWPTFSQIRTKDAESLPQVLSRDQVRRLLLGIRLRRYRTPIKLIYLCGLRLSECLSITVHDILGKEQKLRIRHGKGNRERMVPIPSAMVRELREYWKFHRNPLLLFPGAGMGGHSEMDLAKRMHHATRPMPYASVQRLIVVAREKLNIPAATVHTLRHSYATHLLEAGAHPHTIQKLLGHQQIESTMVYLHLTHQTEQDTLKLVEGLSEGLPR